MRLFPTVKEGLQPGNMTLAIGGFLLGLLLVYGFAYFGIGLQGLFKPVGGTIIVLSFILIASYLGRYFNDQLLTHCGGGLSLLLVALRLYLALSISESQICHVPISKWAVLILSFAGALLLLYGLFRLLDKKPSEGSTSAAQPRQDDQVGNFIWLLMALLVHLMESNNLLGAKSEPEKQSVDKEEIKNLTLILAGFLSLFIFVNQFILKCWW